MLIARYCQRHDLAAWTPLSAQHHKLRGLVRCLQSLTDDRRRILNRLEGLRDSAIRRFWRENLRFLDERMEVIEKELHRLGRQDAELKRQTELLASIPGIGDSTAFVVLAEIPDIRAFGNARQLAAYAGLTPANRQSGSSIRRRASLSKRGNSTLRKSMYMPALSSLRCNPDVAALAERLKAKGKAKMAVIGAAMRKLLHIIFGVLKSGRPYSAMALVLPA